MSATTSTPSPMRPFPGGETRTKRDHTDQESVCAEADRVTSTEREHGYGHPAEDFGKVTGMAQALWGRGPVSPVEHAIYMILVKLSREVHEHKRDNLVDICGYARTIERIMERE